ncbi:aldehyde dehydrogenase family protein [Ilumatobacter nonamiensis]|uniref:aldehyde dehydrogenase family protein n=1 Tax=Ilumatobacter nonamiensis TaxID=467093 RepID=UPI000348780E|nr:aldehyde dehydrogenase family protein [Ilumatobacter nonamiensis]
MTDTSLQAIAEWDHATWKSFAAELTVDGRNVIDGERRDALDGSVIDSVDPTTGRIVGRIAGSGASDVDAAVATARATHRRGDWSRLPPRERAAVLFRWADLVETNAAELCALDTVEMGRPISDMVQYDLPEVVTTIRFFAEAIDKITGTTTATDPAVLHYTLRQPYGVVAAISPWNYPLLMATWKFTPALAAGNCVILKPAEQAALSALRMADLFLEAGGPPGAFAALAGLGEHAGRALGLHAGVDKITFTGSTEVGKELLVSAGNSNMKEVALECGGKSPQLFFADLDDLDTAVDSAIDGIFDNMGEVCNAGSRLLVDVAIHDEFCERFAERAAGRYVPGDPLDPATRCGPLVDQESCARVTEHIATAARQGARSIFAEVMPGGLRDGAFVAPIAYADVDPSMTIARDEIFGPVAAIIPFSSEREAIDLANDSEYGLAAGIWTSDLDRAHRCVRDLEAGTIWVNTFNDGDMTQPFGGWKQSGNSRDKCIESLIEYTQEKSAWFSLGESAS